MEEKYTYRQIRAFRDIITRVFELQRSPDEDFVIRDHLIKNARRLARESGPGYWLEVADVNDGDDYNWKCNSWYEEKSTAVHTMECFYAVDRGKKVYRIVNENEIIDARMRTDLPKQEKLDY